MRYLISIFLIMVISILITTAPMEAEVYRWIDKNGNVFFSDSPPPGGSFKKQKVEDEVDRNVEQRKEIEKQSEVDEREKLDQKIKLEVDYQKKTKAIRDYQAMREELDALREKYQKKFDYLREQLNRTYPGYRGGIYKDIEKLKRDYEKETKQIRNLYGYY